VPYALFENDERLTRPFRTEREVWEAAERADLITVGTRGEKVLDNNFEIKPCEAAPEELAGAPQDTVFPERVTGESQRNGSVETQLPSRQFKTKERSS
jgi:hypothetical protein